MKKKKSRIFSIALTVTLLASLFAFAVPVAATPGNMQWDVQDLPTDSSDVLQYGTNVTDIAVASDGKTIYVVNDDELMNTDGTVAWALYKSTNVGQSFTQIDLSGITNPQAFKLGNVAVAPDNPDAIAISTRDSGTTDTVFVSNNGGTTWSELPPIVGAHVNAAIMDLAVGPARTGTLLGREYLVAVADEGSGVTTLGDVQIIGGTATWVTVDSINVDAQADYMAVAFSPNFIADRRIVAVGSGISGNPGSFLHIINTVSGVEIRSRVVLDSDVGDFGDTSAGILAADIALPSDFDPTTSAGERSYASIASENVTGNDGVFRVDADISRDLGLAGIPFKSVAYNGTIDAGKLFVGYYAATTVRHTAEPTVASPVWTTTKKVPTGTDLTVVRVAADYATTERVFAGTFSLDGEESAFSVSNNAGVSFDQESLIDSTSNNNVVEVNDIVLTPDGGTMFMVTDDGLQLSLWKSATPVGAKSWSRIYNVTAAGPGIVRLNPDWATDPVLYFIDTSFAAPLNGVNNVFLSTNGGDTYSIRSSPVDSAAITDAAIESASVVYVAQGSNVHKSSIAGAWYVAAVAGKAGTIISMEVPKADHILVGGTNAVSYSTNGGSSFTKIDTGLPSADYQIFADEDYATNNIIYAGASTNLIYRFTIGTSTTWESLVNTTGAAIVGLGMHQGTLYGMSAASAERTLGPHKAAGTVSWDIMNAGAAPSSVANFASSGSSNVLYAADDGTNLWAYSDYLATAKPVLTSPGDGYTVGIDPVTGRADLVTLAWEPMGSGSGLVDWYDIRITEVTDTGWDAATAALDNARNVADPLSPQVTMATTGATWLFAMRANTEYMWRVRAATQMSTDDLISAWSASRTLSVQAGGIVQAPQAGVLLLGPVAGAVDVSRTPGFSWAPIAGATEYEFILATDAGLTQTVEDTPVYVDTPSWQVPTTPGTLEYDTTYFWAVKATKPTVGVQSIGTFTTMAELVAPLPPPDLPEPMVPTTPGYIWAIIIIGAILMIAVLVLIMRTRRAA